MIKYIFFLLFLQSFLTIKSHSKSIVRTLPGYNGYLPFKLETGYVRIGEEEDGQMFYYFIESTRNPETDPLIIHFPGGPGSSAILAIFDETGPLQLNKDNISLTLNPDAWTQMANMVYVDIPAGVGYSYAETQEGWFSSDTILATQCKDFVKKFMSDHPEFLQNPLYISGISYNGIVIPKTVLELYEGNERGDEPALNLQGYILCSPLTNKFLDFNSRFIYAHRMALISDDIYKSAIANCHGNYVDLNSPNLACRKSLQSYQECISRINVENILDQFCESSHPMSIPDCENGLTPINNWTNLDVVKQALNVNQGMVGKVVAINFTLHYKEGEDDTIYYAYDIFSSFSYHKKLSSKNCRALIMSGDHDLTFPYVGVEQWISSLNLKVTAPWKPFYVDYQVGGYVTEYKQSSYSLTYATFKGAGHSVPHYKPRESFVFVQRWFSSQTYSSDS